MNTLNWARRRLDKDTWGRAIEILEKARRIDAKLSKMKRRLAAMRTGQRFLGIDEMD